MNDFLESISENLILFFSLVLICGLLYLLLG